MTRLLLILCTLVMIGTPASTAIVPSGALPDDSARLAELEHIPGSCAQPVDKLWIAKVESIKWVAYSWPNTDTGGYHRPDTQAIYADLLTLKKAGFTGLITYGSSGIMGKQFLTIAGSLGYQGIIMGIWSPAGADELNNAANAASLPIVLGYSIGNEGLGESRPRYSVLDLCAAIAELRARTGKPVATSEDIEIYYRWPPVLTVGDWIFPISHPYWHFTKYAPDAIQWEQDQYAALAARTSNFVFFKEVGLPTAGAAGLSEANQDEYYRGLAKTDVRFAYFEGFDQPSKTGASVEPHWGLFNSDLTPKLLAWNMMGYRLFTGGAGSTASIEECAGTGSGDCSINPAGTLMFVGDERGGREYSALLSFNTAGLPDNATVTAVKLKIKAAGVVGTDPLNARRTLTVEACTPVPNRAGGHPGVISPDTASCDPAGTFGDTPNSGWYTVELAPSAYASIDLQGASRFRILLSGPDTSDSPRSYIQFHSPDSSESDSPILLVKYHVP